MNICFQNYWRLVIKCYDRFSGSTKLWSSEGNPENNTISNSYLNEESDYPEVNICDNKIFRSTILYQGKKVNIFTRQLPIYYIHLYAVLE